MEITKNQQIYYASLSFSKQIFADEAEKFFFLKGVEQIRSSEPFDLYAFCVMDDMLYFLIETGPDGPDAVQRILKGSMESMKGRGPQSTDMRERIFSFENARCFVQPVPTLNDLVEVMRYIHLLPVEFRYVLNPSDHYWSSFSCYRDTKGKSPWSELVSSDKAVSMLSQRDVQARARLIQLHRKGAQSGNMLPECLKSSAGLRESISA